MLVAASLPYALKAQANASAFVRWRDQLEQLFADEDIYQRHGYPNPPMMALVLYPLTWILFSALLWWRLGWPIGVAALIALPILGYIALRFAEQHRNILPAMHPVAHKKRDNDHVPGF